MTYTISVHKLGKPNVNLTFIPEEIEDGVVFDPSGKCFQIIALQDTKFIPYSKSLADHLEYDIDSDFKFITHVLHEGSMDVQYKCTSFDDEPIYTFEVEIDGLLDRLGTLENTDIVGLLANKDGIIEFSKYTNKREHFREVLKKFKNDHIIVIR